MLFRWMTEELNNESERVSDKAVVAYHEVISLLLSRGIERNYRYIHSKWAVSGASFEPNTWGVERKNATHSTAKRVLVALSISCFYAVSALFPLNSLASVRENGVYEHRPSTLVLKQERKLKHLKISFRSSQSTSVETCFAVSASQKEAQSWYLIIPLVMPRGDTKWLPSLRG